jgi:DNA mismatch repair protein MutS
MRQWHAAKAGHKDALLFFRLGDFYELFYDDAVVAARLLDLTLTSRNKGAEDEIPMAGVPYHAASGYIQRLLDQGHKVALVEQLADPSKVKGIVPRDVVRVVTPAIVFDDAGLDARENLYLVALAVEGAAIGLASLDLSTGELSACAFYPGDGARNDQASVLAALARLDPRELLVEPGAEEIARAFRVTRPRLILRENLAPLGAPEVRKVLDDVLGEGEAERATRSVAVQRAAARCLVLARECEPNRALPVERLVVYDIGDTLVLDDSTQGHLELVRSLDGEKKTSLLANIDETKTAAGARLLRRRLLAPRTKLAEIRRRHDAVELFVTQPGLRNEIRERLQQVFDLERLAVKLAIGRAMPRDLAALRTSLAELPAIAAALAACPDKSARDALEIAPGGAWIDECHDLHDMLVRAVAEEPPLRVSDGGVIREGWDAELDEARTLQRDGQRLIVELEVRLKESAQIGTLKLRYTRVFGWYMEVTKSHVAKVPKEWRRKQTVASGERFTCDELDELASKMAHAEERAQSRENELYADLVRKLADEVERLRDVAERLATWDVATALAEVAHRDDYVRPELDESLTIEIEDGRHPVVEKIAAAGRFVPNDVALDAAEDAAEREEARLWLVTGPNMAGKSTLMRQVALAVILAQMGSFVPARRARIGLVDRVLTRVGASDNVAKGDSTFMVEMKETANVLRRATKRSLVVLDEIGRGTSTYDGLAIAWAVAEYLHDVVGCRAMFATHYHELTELAETHSGLENWSVSAREHDGDIVFFHKLQRGAASRSYGVACAKLAGLPELVLARARTLLGELESGAAMAGRAPPKKRPKRPQLGLFEAPAPEPAAVMNHPALDALRAVEVDRLTPLEALQLVAQLKKSLS